eukprot:613644-Ditylum_brightwellii.AAC.2
MMLMTVLMVLRSTLYISHKFLIVIVQIEASKNKLLVLEQDNDVHDDADDGEDDVVGNGDNDVEDN